MSIQPLFYYFKRVKQLGFSGTWQAINKRITAHSFRKIWQKKALAKQANHTWEQIAAQHNVPPFPVFFEELKQHNFIEKIMCDTEFQELLPTDCKNTDTIKHKADQASRNCFDILGSGQHCFTKIPWHADFKLPINQSPDVWKSAFYQDIQICTKSNGYSPDVKVPWELSRLQHIYFLGMAGDVATFQNHVNDWINQNPYLLGINWKCPMDVAIRAINLIWGFYFFCHDQNIPESFWQKLICSLYDHLHYIEHNWETSDKPNNHYLADLLGHSYLFLFFVTIKNNYATHRAIIANFIKQINHQIASDGTSYEGSTNYHMLVTEMALHFKLLCKANNIPLPSTFHEKYKLMEQFISDCTDDAGNFVTIGDDDSGKIVTGIKISPAVGARGEELLSSVSNHAPPQPITTYQNFGINIIRHAQWYITFRHPTYQQYQPSGHFHQDQLSITMSMNNVPVLIDPGSYLYTANSAWRNSLRHAQSHNTFYLEHYAHNNRYLEQQDLFQLTRNKHFITPIIQHDNQSISIQDYHTVYDYLGLTAQRKLIVTKTSIMLEDWFEQSNAIEQSITCSWTLIFDPAIDLIQNKDNNWIIKKEKNTLGQLSTSLDFIRYDGYYAPTYGKIEKTIKLCATTKVSPKKQFILFS